MSHDTFQNIIHFIDEMNLFFYLELAEKNRLTSQNRPYPNSGIRVGFKRLARIDRIDYGPYHRKDPYNEVLDHNYQHAVIPIIPGSGFGVKFSGFWQFRVRIRIQ